MDLRVSVENVDKNDSNWANRGLARVLAAGDHGVEDGDEEDEDGDEEDDVEDPHLSSN